MHRPEKRYSTARIARIILFWGVFGAATPSLAWNPDEIRAAPEFTFSNPRMINSLLIDSRAMDRIRNSAETYRKQKVSELLRWYETYCAKNGCTVVLPAANEEISLGLHFRVDFPDGYWFAVTRDPNVFEIKSAPPALREIHSTESRVQTLIFDVMKAHGLKPTSLYGSGHLNLDYKTGFNSDPRAVMNFIAEYFNHPGLATGVLEFDPYNARSPNFFPPELKAEYENLSKRVFAGEIKTPKELVTAFAVIHGKEYGKFRVPLKYSPISILSFADGRNPAAMRVEIRALRAQRTAREFTREADLFARHAALVVERVGNGERIAFDLSVAVNSPSQMLSQFYYYVTDVGLRYETHGSPLLHGIWKTLPFSKDRRSAFGPVNACGALLKKTDATLASFLRWIQK